MHNADTHQKFIERRAQGWSYLRISSELGVAKSTLIEWSRKFQFEINNQRAIELDDLRTRVLGSTQSRVSALTEQLSKIEAELRQRDLSTVPTARLITLSQTLRHEIERELGQVSFVTPVKNIPNDEYIDQVQQWRP